MNAYLITPITSGYLVQNYLVARDIQQHIKVKTGIDIINPADITLELDGNHGVKIRDRFHDISESEIQAMMIGFMIQADVIIVGEGWKKSDGCIRELGILMNMKNLPFIIYMDYIKIGDIIQMLISYKAKEGNNGNP